MGPLRKDNLPVLVGIVLAGVGLIFYFRSREPAIRTGPALTLYPSTQADQSTIVNLTNQVNAMVQAQTTSGA